MVKVQRRHYEKTMQDLYEARSKYKKLKKKYDTLQIENKLLMELKQLWDKFKGKFNSLKEYAMVSVQKVWPRGSDICMSNNISG